MMQPLDHFARTISQFQYELYSHCFIVAVRLEFCTVKYEVCSGVYHDLSYAELQNLSPLFVETSLGIERYKYRQFHFDRTLLQVS